MRTLLAVFFLTCCLRADAHIGSPNVFLEDKAGEYSVRVVIRPPQVVPGLAEITVRLQEPVQRVSVLPVFWNAGRDGSPPPDEARLVRGQTNLYSAQLWLMKSGAYSVDVTIDGSRGHGTLVVPVNAAATNTMRMSRGYTIMLSAMGLILILGALMIARAVFGESRLDPSVLPTRKDRWLGRAAMVGAALFLSILMWGGKSWWEKADADYRNNSLYKPLPILAEVRTDHDQLMLTLKVDPSERRGEWTPLIADHGKLMHLFLVRDGTDRGAFAHLHPVLRSESEFEVPLPPLPAGKYFIYADVTHEDGFSETLIATSEIPSASPAMKKLWLGNSTEVICSAAVAQMLATNLFFAPDPDDSWQMDSGSRASSAKENSPRTADASGGYKIVWENSEALTENLDASLRFKLLMPDNQPALIELYMGMHGHAVVRRNDGAVFAHIHPVGTFSMAAQQFFLNANPSEKSTRPNVVVADYSLHNNHTNQIGSAGEVSFPYAFPQAGTYRLWIQMKSQGRILTGVFDTTVAATR